MMMLRMRFLQRLPQPSFCNEQLASKDKAQPSRVRLCFYAGWSVAPMPSWSGCISESYTEFADWHLLSQRVYHGNFPFHIDEVR